MRKEPDFGRMVEFLKLTGVSYREIGQCIGADGQQVARIRRTGKVSFESAGLLWLIFQCHRSNIQSYLKAVEDIPTWEQYCADNK